MVPAILFYDVVLAVHIAAIVLAFGVTFAYPILQVFLTKSAPEAVPGFHRAQARVDGVLTTPMMALALIAGIYLASDRDYFSEVWVVVPLVILVVLFGVVGGFLTPTERRLADLAERDLAAAGPVRGAESSALVLVAIFFMVTKLGA